MDALVLIWVKKLQWCSALYLTLDCCIGQQCPILKTLPSNCSLQIKISSRHIQRAQSWAWVHITAGLLYTLLQSKARWQSLRCCLKMSASAIKQSRRIYLRVSNSKIKTSLHKLASEIRWPTWLISLSKEHILGPLWSSTTFIRLWMARHGTGTWAWETKETSKYLSTNWLSTKQMQSRTGSTNGNLSKIILRAKCSPLISWIAMAIHLCIWQHNGTIKIASSTLQGNPLRSRWEKTWETWVAIPQQTFSTKTHIKKSRLQSS